MGAKQKNNGSVMLITVFIVALLSAVVIGMLQINTEEIQLMQNHIFAAQAFAAAEAGLNDAFSRIRNDDEWNAGFSDKPFNGGVYDVNVTGTLPYLTIVSESSSAQGFVARLEADVTVDTSGSGNYAIRIDNLRVNE